MNAIAEAAGAGRAGAEPDVSEALCDEPQKELVQAMLAELRGMLDEFEEAYFSS